MLSLRFDQKRKIEFFWQNSYESYLNECARHSLLRVFDHLDIDWVRIEKNRAEVEIEPPRDSIYSVSLHFNMAYDNEVHQLPIVVN